MRRVWRRTAKRSIVQDKSEGSILPSFPCSRAQPSVVSKRQNCVASTSCQEFDPGKGKLQNEAIAILFNEVARLRWWRAGDFGPRTKTAKEATREIAALRDVTQRIQEDAETLRDLGLGFLSPSLDDVAKVCIDFADMYAAHNEHDVLIVSRNRSRLGGPWERGFVIAAAHKLEHFFGQKMQGLVAVLANVAFDRNDITESQVNGALRRKGVR